MSADLMVKWSDVLDGFRREMAGDNSWERGRIAARLLLAVARECVGKNAAYANLAHALETRLAALYPGQVETARQIVSALSDQDIAMSLLVDDRGLGLGNPHFEGLAYPKQAVG
jgi:hypothetical protein